MTQLYGGTYDDQRFTGRRNDGTPITVGFVDLGRLGRWCVTLFWIEGEDNSSRNVPTAVEPALGFEGRRLATDRAAMEAAGIDTVSLVTVDGKPLFT